MVVIVLVLAAIGSGSKSASSPAAASPTPAAPIAAATGGATETPTVEPSTPPTTEPTPEPTATVAPTPKPKPTPAPPILKLAGRGDKVVRFTAQDAPTVARITGKGSGNFAVVSYAGSVYGDLLVNEIGAYAGWVYVAAGENRLKVSSSGSWTIEVRPITAARAWDGLGALTGKGDTVVLLSGGASGTTTIKNRSSSNFAVIAYSPAGDYLDLLVNEIGAYSGEVLLPDADPIVLSIHDVGGTWSMSAVQP